jgi:LacI family transcriptional regulator
LLACSYYDQEDELKQVRALIADGIAGLLLVGRNHSPALYSLLEKERIPLVNGWTVDPDHPYVGFDNVAVGRRLAEYLLACIEGRPVTSQNVVPTDLIVRGTTGRAPRRR